MVMIAKDFADAVGISKAAVSKALRLGRLHAVGKLIDTDFPLNARFIQKHRQDAAYQAAIRRPAVTKPAPEPVAAEPDDGEPGDEVSYLEILADMGAGFQPVIRHSFDVNDLERDELIYPLPRAVRVSYNGNDPVVYDDKTGEEYPTTSETVERGVILARRTCA